ncbi:MAG: 3-hydroxyacyl-ACP dehydratase FabZ [Deltaproteobacteria bacterium]|nr:3-hydroxyacyl-ACP dehydratase FabZ [Deltaproteobacteria bacterium]
MGVYDIQKIMQLLPHRYPFLLIDRVEELVPGKKIIALKNVTINEPFFQGHFPGIPVMPGVIILEAMGQAGGVLAYASFAEKMENKIIFFTGIDKARFRKPVVPGDQLIFELTLIRKRAKLVRMAGIATVDGKRVAEAELMAAYGEKT